mmetsp:Transcript_10876/g.14154  ORF Transcript_10876/g.14154 Transcript_10876/m.14154 type:complete len:778 (-) Transcript_10876:296-2629(-)
MDGGWVTGTCLVGHKLKEFRTFYAGYTCSHCTLAFPRKTTLRGCRKCDYDICKKCDAENAMRSASLPSSRRANSRRPSSASSHRSSMSSIRRENSRKNEFEFDSNEIKITKSDHDNTEDVVSELGDDSIPRSVSAPASRNSPIISRPPAESDSDDEIDIDDDDVVEDVDSLHRTATDSVDSYETSFSTDQVEKLVIDDKNTLNRHSNMGSSSSFKIQRRCSDITLFDSDNNSTTPQDAWALTTSPRPVNEETVLSSVRLLEEAEEEGGEEEEEEASMIVNEGQDKRNDMITDKKGIRRHKKDNETLQQDNSTFSPRSVKGNESVSLDHDAVQSVSTNESERDSSRSDKNQRRTSKTQRPKVNPTSMKRNRFRDISPIVTSPQTSPQSSPQSSPRRSSPHTSPSKRSSQSNQPPQTPPRSPPRSSSPRSPRSSFPGDVERRQGSLTRPSSSASLLKKRPSPQKKRENNSSSSSLSSSLSSSTTTNNSQPPKNDEELGITDQEMANAYAELEGIVYGTASKPENVKLLNQGKIGRGGWWTLHGLVDVDTGLLQLYLEGHFAVPLSIMERCVLDETFQKTYDPFLRIKEVIGTIDGNDVKNDKNDIDDETKKRINPPSSSSVVNGDSKSTPLRNGLEKGCEVMHHEIKFPAPFSNRDYVFYRRGNLEEHRFSYVQRDVEPRALASKYIPPRKGVIRAGNGKYWQFGMCVEEKETQVGGCGRCLMVVRSQDNIEGKVPKWLSNLAAKQGAPGYVKQLEKAAVNLMVEEGTISKQQAKTLWR